MFRPISTTSYWFSNGGSIFSLNTSPTTERTRTMTSTINTPVATLMTLLKMGGAKEGWGRTDLIGEAAQQLVGTPDDTWNLTEVALGQLMVEGVVKPLGIKQHDLVALT